MANLLFFFCFLSPWNSRRIQQQTYNNTSPIERKRKAVEFAGRVFKRIVFDKDSQGDSPTITAISLGSIVGLRVLDGSTAFGKVIRMDSNDALLMLLKPQNTTADYSHRQEYVADIGNLVRKKLSAHELIFPVDGTFCEEKGVYEMLTRLDDIDRLLK